MRKKISEDYYAYVSEHDLSFGTKNKMIFGHFLGEGGGKGVSVCISLSRKNPTIDYPSYIYVYLLSKISNST